MIPLMLFAQNDKSVWSYDSTLKANSFHVRINPGMFIPDMAGTHTMKLFVEYNFDYKNAVSGAIGYKKGGVQPGGWFSFENLGTEGVYGSISYKRLVHQNFYLSGMFSSEKTTFTLEEGRVSNMLAGLYYGIGFQIQNSHQISINFETSLGVTYFKRDPGNSVVKLPPFGLGFPVRLIENGYDENQGFSMSFLPEVSCGFWF